MEGEVDWGERMGGERGERRFPPTAWRSERMGMGAHPGGAWLGLTGAATYEQVEAG